MYLVQYTTGLTKRSIDVKFTEKSASEKAMQATRFTGLDAYCKKTTIADGIKQYFEIRKRNKELKALFE